MDVNPGVAERKRNVTCHSSFSCFGSFLAGCVSSMYWTSRGLNSPPAMVEQNELKRPSTN